jgi:hypothetical protein
VEQDWKPLLGDEPALGALTQAVQRLSGAFPLVEAEVALVGADVEVRLRAPLFEAGLNQQAFALTISCLLKAAGAFEQMLADRSGQTAQWATLDAEAKRREAEIQKQYESRLAEIGTATKPASS